VERDSTFVFADIAGFTALTEAHGDEQAADLAADFAAAVEGVLAPGAAEQVKTIGDAIMLRFDDAGTAVRAGLRIACELLAEHGAPTVRVGMHTGPAVARGGDWFGASVNLAARIAALAGGGEVLLTGATRAASGDLEDVIIENRGLRELRNVAEPVEVHAAWSKDAPTTSRLVLDPVCRMAVDPARSSGTLSHDGVEYHFCSAGCMSRFAAAPERYVRPAS
jgi:class 3 adenylate cyclase/YHS domain-containing protein